MGDFINFLFDRYDRPSSSCHCHRRWSGGDRNYTDTTTILNAFGNGYTFFGFDLTPDACDGSCFHLVQKGNLRIEIHFAAPLAQTVNVVVYGESEAVLEIDKGRNIIYDH